MIAQRSTQFSPSSCWHPSKRSQFEQHAYMMLSLRKAALKLIFAIVFDAFSPLDSAVSVSSKQSPSNDEIAKITLNTSAQGWSIVVLEKANQRFA